MLGEPAFAHLLPPAGFVERDDEVGLSVSKSAGGSLNARWAFSPMPTKATSIGRRGDECPDLARRHRAGPARRRAGAPFRARRFNQALAQVPPEARRMVGREPDVLVEMEQLDATPWHAGAAVSASRNSNCDAPVAAMIRATPRASIARAIPSAAWAAAARPRAARSGRSLMSTRGILLATCALCFDARPSRLPGASGS